MDSIPKIEQATLGDPPAAVGRNLAAKPIKHQRRGARVLRVALMKQRGVEKVPLRFGVGREELIGYTEEATGVAPQMGVGLKRAILGLFLGYFRAILGLF